ncbi:UDP-glucose 4-epimerase GalE [Oscillibacter sp.]|uniref:UDP-glucose 4-epimerase GalE n=1 Tax=Oscillibacter sp. TaxID=1945593 RepID=UPI0028A650F7|nr:UDP-glucose 4-epimerase GalE [Oscillibacter sp.]
MAILVLGGAGYIGSHTALALLNAGRDVVVADSLKTGFRAAVPPAARFYQGDIRDRSFCDSLFEREQIDGVIHFAASSLVGESMSAPLRYYDNNLGGTRVLLESMTSHGVRDIVFSSSAAVYGEPERVPISETDRTIPTNCYGDTKLAIERMMKWAAQAHGLRYAALRYFNACGAQPGGAMGEAHDPETHLIPLILQVANGSREQISIFGDDYPTPDGTCIRDYVHVCDLARAHILALNYLAAGGESDAFNLGSGAGFSVRQVLEEARRVTGHSIPARIRPRRAGDPARLVALADRARVVLGWVPEYGDLCAILQTAWDWHRTHPDGYEQGCD